MSDSKTASRLPETINSIISSPSIIDISLVIESLLNYQKKGMIKTLENDVSCVIKVFTSAVAFSMSPEPRPIGSKELIWKDSDDWIV